MGKAKADAPTKPGRPTKCDEERVAKLCDLIRKGNYLSVAARACGVSIAAVKVWRRKGKEGIEPYVAFVAALKKADSDAELHLVSQVQLVGAEDWKAFMTTLERRWPRRWGRNRVQLDELEKKVEELTAKFDKVLEIKEQKSARP